MNNYSMEGRILFRSLVGITFALVVFAIIIDEVIVSWLRNQADTTLLNRARVLVTLTKDLDEGLDFDFADEFMPEFDRTSKPDYYQLWVEGVGVFEKSERLYIDLPKMPFSEIGHQFQNIEMPDGRRQGRMVQVVFIPQIPDKDKRTPERLAAQSKVTLAVATSTEDLERLVITVHSTLLVGITLLLGFVILQVWLTIHNGLAPLREVGKQLNNIDSTNLDNKLYLDTSPIELDLIVGEFNNLLYKVKNALDREQRFSEDVAHELKTPITELRTIAEVALMRSENAAGNHFYKDVLDAAKQMESTVTRLFQLARFDKGKISVEFKPVDLVSILRKNWSRCYDNMVSKQQRLYENYPIEPAILSSEEELNLVFINIIENAVNYGSECSEIRCELYLDKKGELSISFSNETDSLDQDDLPQIFNRLWQKDEARSGGHAGLGLPLVKAYAELLQLKIDTTISDNRLFTLTITGFKFSNETFASDQQRIAANS